MEYLVIGIKHLFKTYELSISSKIKTLNNSLVSSAMASIQLLYVHLHIVCVLHIILCVHLHEVIFLFITLSVLINVCFIFLFLSVHIHAPCLFNFLFPLHPHQRLFYFLIPLRSALCLFLLSSSTLSPIKLTISLSSLLARSEVLKKDAMRLLP